MTETTSDELEVRIATAGRRLLDGFTTALEEVPEASSGPQKLADRLGVDKVLASRLLKALRTQDPLSVIHRMPGPDPLRRVSASLSRAGVAAEALAGVDEAIEAYDRLIKQDAGDLSGLQAILSSWVPEARREFEGRRLQAAYRAVSQLKGASVDVYADTAFFWPNEDGETIDVVWLKALVNLASLRPGATIALTSHRAVEEEHSARRPRALSGAPIEDYAGAIVPEFCAPPSPDITVRRAGEKVHYLLDQPAYGSAGATSVVTCEINRAEMPRYVDPARGRVAWASSEPSVPAKKLQFDCFVHEDLWGGAPPTARVYDTAIGGIVDVNDPSRDIDRLDLSATAEPLGRGLARARSNSVPRYHAMLERVREAMGWDADAFLAYRVEVEYPLYGSQTALLFRTVGAPN